MIDMTPEQTATLTLLGRPDSHIDRSRTINWSSLDWAALTNTVASNIQPYLHASIIERGLVEQVPEDIWSKMCLARHVTSLRHLRWTSEIRRIIAKMDEQRIPCLFLKGADLKFRLYADATTRPMNDLDLLVKSECFQAAQQALQAVGYQPRYNPAEATPFPNRIKPWEEVIFYKQVGHDILMIELKSQTESAPNGKPVAWESLWHGSLPHSFSNDEFARVLCPTALIKQLSMHLIYNHKCEHGLLWLLDIRLAVEKWHKEIDWPLLQQHCHADHSEGVMGLALHLISIFLGAPGYMAEFNPNFRDKDHRMSQLAWQQLFTASMKRRSQLLKDMQDTNLTGKFSIIQKRLASWASKDWMESMSVKYAWWQVPPLMIRRASRDLKTYRANRQHGDFTQADLDQHRLLEAGALELKTLLTTQHSEDS